MILEMLLSLLALNFGKVYSLLVKHPTIDSVTHMWKIPLHILPLIQSLLLLLFFHLFEKPLSLLSLLLTFAGLFAIVFSIEVCASTDIRSLGWVLIVQGFSSSLHILIIIVV